MMEYLAYKKFRRTRDAKVQERDDDAAARAAAAAAAPVLTDDDERFLERLVGSHQAGAGEGFADVAGMRPPLPPRVKTPEYAWDSETDSYVGPVRHDGDGDAASDEEAKLVAEVDMHSSNGKGKGNGKEEHDGGDRDRGRGGGRRGATIHRLNLWIRRPKKDTLDPAAAAAAAAAIPAEAAARERADLARVLDDLNLAARNNKTFSLTADSQALVGQFTVVLKDLVNGVPTAATDLRHLLDDHDGTLARNYDRLPGSLKKMVTSLPDKLTSSLAPELLAVAAASQGREHEVEATAAAGRGLKDQALRLLMPKNWAELVTKPGAVVGMLKAIVNALKLRWPAFIGTNVLWSVALFLLLFVLWYCHKRGREVRLEKETAEAAAAAAAAAAEMDGPRVEELSDMDSAARPVSPPLAIEPPTPTPPALLEGPPAGKA